MYESRVTSFIVLIADAKVEPMYLPQNDGIRLQGKTYLGIGINSKPDSIVWQAIQTVRTSGGTCKPEHTNLF